MWEHLKSSDKKIVLYGTGNACERIMRLMDARGLKPASIFASDDFVRGQIFHGIPVESYSAVKSRFGADGMIVLLCFGTHRAEVLANIEKIASETEFLAPDIAVVPEFDGSGNEIVFDKAFMEANSERISALRGMLEDEQSVRVFDSVISYRLSGDIGYLRACETSPEIPWSLAIERRNAMGMKCSSLLDLGAYTGDTAELFMSLQEGLRTFVTAVEPDDRNFIRLRDKYAEKGDMRLIHAAAGESEGTALFSQGGGRGSLQKKKREVQVVTIDSLCKDFFPDVIKLDIVGMEAEALRGGHSFISSHAPALIVSAYHRVSDMWELPLLIKSFRNDYRIYLRRSPCVPNWELEYLFVL